MSILLRLTLDHFPINLLQEDEAGNNHSSTFDMDSDWIADVESSNEWTNIRDNLAIVIFEEWTSIRY